MNALLDTPDRLDEHALPLGQLLFGFRGRISRRTYWRVGVFGVVGAGLLLSALLAIAGLSVETAERSATVLLMWPTCAISAKRWHDRGRGSAWALLNLVPGIGQLWTLLDNGLVRSDPGPNAYGPPEARSLLD